MQIKDPTSSMINKYIEKQFINMLFFVKRYLLERSFTRESLNLINSELVKYNGMKDAGPSDSIYSISNYVRCGKNL